MAALHPGALPSPRGLQQQWDTWSQAGGYLLRLEQEQLPAAAV